MRRRSLAAAIGMALVLPTPAAGALLAPEGATAQPPDYVTVPPVLERAPEDALYVAPRFTPVRTYRGVVYGGNVTAAGNWQDLILDVWEPDGHDAQFRPVIVWAAGGFGSNVGTEQFRWMLKLVERGYVLASIEYRIREDHPEGGGLVGWVNAITEGRAVEGAQSFLDASHDAQHDMQAAVRWLRANAARLRIDPYQITSAGYSAGAAIASRVLYNPDDPGESGNPEWPSHVAAGIMAQGGYLPVFTGGPILPGAAPASWFVAATDILTPPPTSMTPCVNAMALGNVCEYHLFRGDRAFQTAREGAIAVENADFLWRHVIDVDRIATEVEDVRADGHGGTATVTGRLVTDDGAPLAGARVLGRATAGWAETTTADDGTFSLTVDAPDHGQSTDVLLRYEGHSTGSWLDDPQIAPTHTTVTATWGGGTAGR